MPSPTELLIILLIVLMLFGYKRVPQLLSGLGESIVGFKKAMREADDVREDLDEPLPRRTSHLD